MKLLTSGMLSGPTYSGIRDLQFIAESSDDERVLKILFEYYTNLINKSNSIEEKSWLSLHTFLYGRHNLYDFQEILLVIDGILTYDEVSRASGCLGYALREVLSGEDLSGPSLHAENNYSKLSYYYDSTKSRRDDIDYIEVFTKSLTYIEHGSPIRKTNRAGIDTKGTRLVDGIGKRNIKIFLR
jgi:hypothetical protein